MSAKHTSSLEDELIDLCESFGGKAEELAKLLIEFDDRLDQALDSAKEFEDENKTLKAEIEELKTEISDKQEAMNELRDRLDGSED